MEITKQEYNFITYHFLRIIDPLPYFYLLMKVHKPTLVTRPIVSYPGSTFHALGIWVDTQLQQVAKSFDSYVESSFQLIDELKLLLLPPNALLFLCDANSMYTNIDTTTAINAIEDYLTANQHNFPTLPVIPVIEALELIMRHNVFQFGDTYWLQKKGTAMGAPPACSYANISFAVHELVFLPKYKNSLFLYKRYIDDIFGIWLIDKCIRKDNSTWQAFGDDLNGWTGLTWKIGDRRKKVTFLDVELEINNNKIKSIISEKPENLHLYLPVRSAHPPGVLQGLIAGYIYRARSLCTDQDDAVKKINELFTHLKNRGYASSTLRPIFQKYLNRTTQQSDVTEHWLFKVPYHPQNPSSAQIRKAWDDAVPHPRLSKPLHRIDVRWNPIGERRFIICYKRHKNLGNLLSYRKIKQNSGPPVSSFAL